MNKLIRCQMCGNEQEMTRDGCVYDICGVCGARIIRKYEFPKTETLTERLAAALEELIDGFEIDDVKLNALIAECRETK